MRSLFRSAGPWLALLTLTAAGAAAAVGYGLTAPKRYRATAQLLVSPVSVSDPNFTGLDVLRDTAGKRTAAATAAALLRSPQVADVVRADLGLARSRDSLLHALDAHVVDSSDVVAVTVEDTSAAGAAQLANAFADGLVKQRTAGFQSQLAATITRDRQLVRGMSPSARSSGAGAELQRRLTVLAGFQGQPDPTLRHAGQASAPTGSSWPDVPRLAAAGAGAGLLAGLLVALLLIVGPLGRRRAVADGAPYDRGVADRLVQRLEERVAARIAALEAERERLSAREAALAVRERDVSAKLAELRAAAPPQLAPEASHVAAVDETALAGREATVAEREAALEARVAELTKRELALARRAAAAPSSEPSSADAAALTEREAALAARIAELTQRELGIARRAAAVAGSEKAAQARAEELERRAAELERQAASAQRAEAPHAAAVPVAVAQRAPERVEPPAAAHAPAEPPGVGGAWNLTALERLVDDRGDEFPDRREEWSSYLFFLREYAEPDGTVPASFDWLIQETFADLVA